MKEVLITIVDTEQNDDGGTYPVTHVFRYDYVGDTSLIIKNIETTEGIIEGGKMSNGNN